MSGMRIDPQLGYWNQPGTGPYAGQKGPLGEKTKQRSKRQLSTDEKSFEELGKEVTEIKEQLELIKKPKGQKDNPSRFCKDLLECSPTIKNGKLLYCYYHSQQ